MGACVAKFAVFSDIVKFVICVVNSFVIPLIFSIAVAVFLWGTAQYILHSSEEAKRKEGRKFMINGIVAIFVMLSVWGILVVLTNTFGLSTFGIPQF